MFSLSATKLPERGNFIGFLSVFAGGCSFGNPSLMPCGYLDSFCSDGAHSAFLCTCAVVASCVSHGVCQSPRSFNFCLFFTLVLCFIVVLLYASQACQPLRPLDDFCFDFAAIPCISPQS